MFSFIRIRFFRNVYGPCFDDADYVALDTNNKKIGIEGFHISLDRHREYYDYAVSVRISA